MSKKLSDKHAQKLRMLSPEVIAARGYQTLEDTSLLEFLGFSDFQQITPTLLVPYFDIWGKNGFSQHRPDNPRQDKDKKFVKYESPKDLSPIIDYNPIQDLKWLQEIDLPLFIVESPIKGDSLITQLQKRGYTYPVLSISGVWGWIEEGKLNEAFRNIKITGRDISIIPDGDILTNENVKLAAARLKGKLGQKRAKEITVIALPEPIGLDDLFDKGFTLAQLFQLKKSQKNETIQIAILKPEIKPSIPKLGDRFLKTVEDDLAFGLRSFRRFTNGYWKEIEKGFIEKLIHNFLLETLPEGVTYNENMRREIIGYCRNELYVMDDKWDKEVNIVPMKNGNFNLKTFELEEHDKDLYFTSGLDFDYDPKAISPNWDKTISTAKIPKDERNFFQEYCGYCLTPDTYFEKFLVLVGVKGSGKSTLIEAIKNVFGEDRSCELSLENISSDMFSLGKIVGKSLIISTENTPHYIPNLDKINKIVSGETVTIRLMRQDPFDYKPIAKILYSMNILPNLYNPDNGIYRRINILQFNKPIPPKEVDPNLKIKLLDEKSGIFNWMILGLKRLRERGYFNTPERVLALNKQFEEDNDIIGSFITQVTVEGEFVKLKILYDLYKFWCNKNQHKPYTRRNFEKRLEELGYIEERYQKGKYNIKSTIKNISLNSEFLEEFIEDLPFFPVMERGKDYK